MNVNESLVIAKCKNGFFVHSNEYGCFSDAISDGVVFQSFYELLQFLNSHFPSDEEKRQIIASDSIQPIIFKQGSHIFLENISEDMYIDLIATQTHVFSVYKPNMYVCVYEPWSLNTFANSHEGLIESIREQIAFLWKNYVREEDENLSEQAIAVKRRLMEDWEEVEIANEP